MMLHMHSQAMLKLRERRPGSEQAQQQQLGMPGLQGASPAAAASVFASSSVNQT